MKNRYGVEYSFVAVGPATYEFHMDSDKMNYCRYGGLEGQDILDYNNLGFFDPSGGPFVSVGGTVENRVIIQIRVVGDQILLEVA